MPPLDGAVREAWLWLGGSLLLAVLWTNLVHLFSPWAEPDRTPSSSKSLAERIVYNAANWRFAPSLFQGLRLAYYVGLPAAALFWGGDAVLSRFLGLQRLRLPAAPRASEGAILNANWSDWIQDLGWAGLLGLGAGGLLLLAAFAQRRALRNGRVGARGGGSSLGTEAREAAYHEVHWAFYRNAPIAAVGLYWGLWSGLALVALEALANPRWRHGLRDRARSWPLLTRGALSVVSSLLFLRAQNLWLAIILHWALAWSVRTGHAALSPTLSDERTEGETPTAGPRVRATETPDPPAPPA